MRELELHCETCRGETLFVVPPCTDGHDLDCPEFACTGCGSAILIGGFNRSRVPGERPAQRVRSRRTRRLAA